jgi:hypothetical protein
MSLSLRCTAVLALAAWLMASEAAQAQRSAPNQPQVITNPQQIPPLSGTTVGVVGAAPPVAVPYGGMGYNPTSPVLGGPSVAAGGGSNPYALSTAPGGYNPYLSNTASMGASASPYGISTTPYPVMPYGMIPPWFGGMSDMGLGYALFGNAEQWRAQGQYWRDIQQARITREQSRQMELDTARRRIEFEAWYETIRPTTPRIRDREIAIELDRARKDATSTDITSGKALNTLLASVQKMGNLTRGASIPLDEEVLKNINLSGGTSAGNIALLKDGGKLSWPETLLEAVFDEPRKRLSDNLRLAVAAVKDREPIDNARMRDIRGDFKTLNDKLSELANELAPSQYVEARRFLNQLNAAIKALSDPKVGNYFNNTWNAKGRTVAELVNHMTREGLTFAPAAPGDEAAYRAVYQALRAFELSLAGAQISTGN